MLGEDSNLLEALRLCRSLLQFRLPENEEFSLLTSALERLTNITAISEEEEEQKALINYAVELSLVKFRISFFKAIYR